MLWGCSDDRAHQKTPTIAYTVIQHAVIDLTKGKGEFADTLTKYFGTTCSEGKDVIDYAETMETRDKVDVDVELQIREALSALGESDQERTRRRFVVDVLSPYLQCVVHGNTLPSDLRQAVHRRYARLFGGMASPNGLAAVVTSIENYRDGGSFHVDSLNLLNRQLLDHGVLFQVENRTQQACLLDVADTLLPPLAWKGGSFSVIEVRRNIPCFLASEFGYSTLATDYVVVVADKVRELAQEYTAGQNPTWNGLTYQSPASERIWTSLGLGMTSDEGNRILQALLRRDFAQKNMEQIADDLTVETAIHEAKHKADEIDLPAMNINFDCEVSAHLTQAICGDSPFHSLADAIGRIEGFYRSSGEADMGKLLFQLWGIAAKAAKPGYPEERLREDLQQVYDGYAAGSSRTGLPPLDAFRRTVVPTIKASVHGRKRKPSSFLTARLLKAYRNFCF